MIARLTGMLAETSADTAIIDVGGVGYLVHASGRTLDALGPVGGEVLILTELQVREDAWTLFGFGSAGRARLLPRTDLGPGRRRPARSRHPLRPFARRAGPRRQPGRQGDDRPRERRRPEAGRPHRQRASGQAGCRRPRRIAAPAPRAGAAADALSALGNLGFKPAEASAAVNAAQDELGRTPASTRWSGWR